MQPRADEGSRIVVLSGIGLSEDYQHFKNATFRGLPMEELSTLEAWKRDRDLVREYFDERRLQVAHLLPSPAHEALARLQHVLGPKRTMLVTQSIDGLLQKAAAHDVIETQGSLFRLRCEGDAEHPRVGVFGVQNREARCSVCQALMRPDVVWSGEPILDSLRINVALRTCDFFMAVGTSGEAEPTATFVRVAHKAGARCIEVNPKPSHGLFHEVINERAEIALPQVFGQWLGDEVTTVDE
ncbi:MAG: hypothetical protein HN348_08890 [Proteobacteria bacterium]|nr:hypothetical protein [Pseudomonadota bacterium]